MNNSIRYIGNLFIGTLLVCIATPLTVSSSDGSVSIMELPPTTLGFLFFFMGFLRAEERRKKKISSIAFFMIIISAVSWSFNMDNALSLCSVLLNGVRITGLLYLLRKVVYFAEEIDRNISDDMGVDWLSLEWKIFAISSGVSFPLATAINIGWISGETGKFALSLLVWCCSIFKFGAAIAMLFCLHRLTKAVEH